MTVARLAEAQDTTSHAFMLEAIREKVEADEARAAFHAEARRRLARMKKTGLGIPADEILAYFRERAAGRNPRRPKPRKIEHIEKILNAVQILDRHPEIGRDVGGMPALRELVISHGGSGYVAMYEYSVLEDLVRVAAIRHQREAGYKEK